METIVSSSVAGLSPGPSLVLVSTSPPSLVEYDVVSVTVASSLPPSLVEHDVVSVTVSSSVTAALSLSSPLDVEHDVVSVIVTSSFPPSLVEHDVVSVTIDSSPPSEEEHDVVSMTVSPSVVVVLSVTSPSLCFLVQAPSEQLVSVDVVVDNSVSVSDTVTTPPSESV
ncbi:unnamed protein product [[Candida] boidinii]|nr:unnamed protein product [[Candida] boidinii]